MSNISGIDRRTLLASVGAGLVGSMALTTTAAAQTNAQTMSTDRAMPPETHRFKVGAFEVVVIKDGARVSENPGQIFGTNQKPEDVSALLEANFLPTASLVNSFAPTLINTGSEVVLFDTGLGEGARKDGMGRLVEGLAAAGYAPEDVSIVVITHMHGDHIGGLMEKGAPAFPKARYVIGQAEYDFWKDGARVGTPAENGHKLVLSNVAPLAEKATFVGDGADVTGGITSMLAAGHSPGHMIYLIESEGRKLVLTADTANHFVLSLQQPDWEVRFDMDKIAAAQTRRKVFDMIATDKLAFLGYHMPFPAVGYVEKAGTGFRYVPKAYQFEL